jgi:hypothetical protein
MTRNPELAVPMTLPEIREDLEQIRERLRSGTAGERKRDLVFLDACWASLTTCPPTRSS